MRVIEQIDNDTEECTIVNPVKKSSLNKIQYKALISEYNKKIHKCNNKWCLRMDVAFHDMLVYMTICKELNKYELDTM